MEVLLQCRRRTDACVELATVAEAEITVKMIKVFNCEWDKSTIVSNMDDKLFNSILLDKHHVLYQGRIQKVWLGVTGGAVGAEVERRKRESSRAP